MTRTPYTGDWGADLVTIKAGIRRVVQAKRHMRPVGVKAVQEAVAAKGMYRCSEAMVVTNSTFTEAARTLARANDVVLWDRTRLISALLSVRGNNAEPATTLVLPDPLPAHHFRDREGVGHPISREQSPVCATCGRTVSAAVAHYCRKHATRFDGRTYCFDHQRPVARSSGQRFRSKR